MTKKRDRVIFGFLAVLFIFTSSALTIGVLYQSFQSKNDTKTDSAANQTKPTGEKMDNFTPTSQPQTELKIIDLKPGTGAEVKAGDTITADYVGALIKDGTIFDASAKHGGPATFPLSGVIAGWSQGIPGMKVGGTRRLLIPAALAYGPQAQNSIPANSDLVFDVTLTKIGK